MQELLNIRYKTILGVAIPLMASSFIQSLVLITDSAFLTRYDTLSFDAAGNAGLLYITVFMALIGISDGAQILMARRIGQNKSDLLSRIFGTTLVTNSIIAVSLFFIINLFFPILINSYSTSNQLASLQSDYLSSRSIGLFFSIFTLTSYAYFMAIGKTSYVFLSALIISATNILLDYGLIFGKLGLPEMGLKGAGYASAFSEGIGMCFLFFILLKSKDRKRHKLFTNISFNTTSLKEVIKFGLPIVFQGMTALATWTVFFIWIEQLGTYELTVSQNIRTMYFLAFVPIWGFNGATKTYISQYVGAGKYDTVPQIIKRIQLLTICFLILIFHGALLYPSVLISAVNPNPIYLKESVEILEFIFFSVLLFGFGSAYFQAINGTGNTRHNFYIEFISVSIYLISAFFFIKVFHFELKWIWSVEYIYFTIMALMSYLYMKYYNWHKKEI